MDQEAEERTLPPSPRRLAEARKQGILPVVTELTAGIGLLGAVVSLSASSGWWQQEMMNMLRRFLSAISHAPSLNLTNLVLLQVAALLRWTTPLFAFLLLLMLLPRTLLGGFPRLTLRWQGSQSTFSLPTAIAQMALLIISVVVILAFAQYWFHASRLLITRSLLTIVAIGLFWASAMGWWQWWRYQQQLRMGLHELLREQQEQAPSLLPRRKGGRV